MVEAADQHGADVVGVRESPARDNPREDDGEAVAVGFGTAELRSQWREGVRSQEAFDVCLVQPDLVDQLRTAVALGFGGDGLVLGGDRQRVGEGKSGYVRVVLGGRRTMQPK